MSKFKKVLALLLVVALTATLSVSLTMAYLQDTDEQVNVMTLGNVYIDQIEQERDSAGKLVGFTRAKPLYPAVYAGNSTDNSIPWDVAANWPVPNDEAWKTVDKTSTNVVDKFVTVKNTGDSPAYVRTIIAFEGDPINGTDIHIIQNSKTSSNSAVATAFASTEYIENVIINKVRYDIIVYTYSAALAPGATTIPSLKQVYMDHTCGNDEVAKYGETYDILVLSQAVQTMGFDTPADAFAAAFPFGTNNENLIDWFEGDEFKIPTVTSVSTAEELTNALTAGGIVVLEEDVTVTETMNIPAGADTYLNLNGNDLSYAVSNSGASAIISNKGTLEIAGEGTISFTAANPDLGAIPSYATNTITNTGKLIIGEGVTVTNDSDGGASYAVDVQSGEFILNGGTLIGKRCALRIARFNQDAVFTMNSGLVKGATPAWIHLPGSNSADAPKVTVTINGGTFQSTKTTDANNDVLYTYSFGNSHANTSITINGGEFLGGTVSIGSGYMGDVPKMIINGGIFEYDVLQWLEGDTNVVLFEANKQ